MVSVLVLAKLAALKKFKIGATYAQFEKSIIEKIVTTDKTVKYVNILLVESI